MALLEKTIELAETSLRGEEILDDYRLALASRQASLIGRREVLSGKAKFGIFGDGKEVAQLALAKALRPGDIRSGYYRDQTLMFALGLHTIPEFFAQLYAHADPEFEPMTAGRAMNAHFATHFLDPKGEWVDLTSSVHSTADISPTGSQMPRLVGLAYASKLYRELPELESFTAFSHNGDEIALGTIGNASCAEGMFWEAVNAAGVLGGPMVLCIWDDDYGISVPNEFQLTKGNISELLQGFQRDAGSRQGYDIYTVPGWDYPRLIDVFLQATRTAREEHVPVAVHVVELTQPQGHSTSGSHERYKTAERLAWEQERDAIRQMRLWILDKGLATPEELDEMEREARSQVEGIRRQAWQDFMAPIRQEREELSDIIDEIASSSHHATELAQIHRRLNRVQNPTRRALMECTRDVLLLLHDENNPTKQVLLQWKKAQEERNRERYSSHLTSHSAESARHLRHVAPVYDEDSPQLSGFEILNHAFDAILARHPEVIAFGEDVGRLGGVNQAFAGLQAKYGALRVADAGIREITIIGQAIGLALRGLRPIAEIQYLDYVLYALQILSDDLASLHWRTYGRQKAPVIVRTRGHRLEGIWHSGSPMSGIVNLVRGMNVLVPRDMTRAAAFYNALLQTDEPGIVVEVLNGYRLKERLPSNLAEISLPFGTPEIVREGEDVTVVTYGAMVRIVLEAAQLLARLNVDVEVIDVQCLLPFDVNGVIVKSLEKTNRILFTDEDVPGGATAYMMQQVLEAQNGFYWLDAPPRTLPAQPHRPPYGTDGDYWSKPNVESVLEAVYEMMHDADPANYPLFHK